MCYLILPRPGGPSAKREPSPEGLGSGGKTRAPEARHSTAPYPQPDFAIPARCKPYPMKINATKSTSQLIWTALDEITPRL
jgi:hypothetical protein